MDIEREEMFTFKPIEPSLGMQHNNTGFPMRASFLTSKTISPWNRPPEQVVDDSNPEGIKGLLDAC